ncbi:MAG: hypothetical protein ACRDQA_19630 [Nocardioidaceae bacterium]
MVGTGSIRCTAPVTELIVYAHLHRIGDGTSGASNANSGKAKIAAKFNAVMDCTKGIATYRTRAQETITAPPGYTPHIVTRHLSSPKILVPCGCIPCIRSQDRQPSTIAAKHYVRRE